MTATRRRFLRAATVGVTGLAGCTGPTDAPGQPTETDRPTRDTDTPDTPAPPPGDVTVRLETVTADVTAPVGFDVAPDGTRYVADQGGVLYTLDADGTPAPALDLRDSIVTGGERGLLGVALHPEFPADPRVFLRYSAPPREGTPDGYDHTFVLASFPADADGTLDLASERALLEIPEPQSNHNSGSIAFGPDEYLYVGVGDGGAANDVGAGHVEDWYDTPGGNGQDVTENLLGSILRIDVDGTADDRPYAIPDDNPLVDEDGLDEHFAWGLRNPWGMSFDGEALYVADVGQNRYEEVNIVERGGNYGWNVREGTHCFGTERCPTVAPGGERLRDPIIEYPHDGAALSGNAVIGGYVYRGDAIPALTDRYVFGDLQANGELFLGVRPDGDGLWPTRVLSVAEPDREKLQTLLAFGRDGAGELYALTRGGVHRIASDDGA